MPAPKRTTRSALILVPEAYRLERNAVMLGRTACRVAHGLGIRPVFPIAYCLVYMTEDEVVRNAKRETSWWARRVDRIWLCLGEDEDDVGCGLDPLCHDILLDNEGLMSGPRHHSARLPVYRMIMNTELETPTIEPIERGTVATILRHSIKSGLFRGMEA